ncbi:MAG TPA: hypothetical protein VE776_11800 [Actinomycetota bacterium]|jgi:hypothetical protein|nr:hypothetical protein [Actinomycetota bacterium]
MQRDIADLPGTTELQPDTVAPATEPPDGEPPGGRRRAGRAPALEGLVVLTGVTAVELREARPVAEYHEMVPNVVYDDPGPIMDRLGRDGGRDVSIAWDLPSTAGQAASITIPPGLTRSQAAHYRQSPQYCGSPAWT